MATSEYCRCPPRLPTPTASHVAIASGVNHRVTSPRWTSARSYAGQFPTRYFVVYLGCTLDFTSRSCPFGRHDGQGRDEHLFPRTNAQFLVTAAVDDTAEGVQFTAQRLVRCPDTAACLRYPGNQTTLLFGLGRKREFDRFKISNLRAPSIAVPGGNRAKGALIVAGPQQGLHELRKKPLVCDLVNWEFFRNQSTIEGSISYLTLASHS